jgi:Flp pilus assembly protein TadD
MEEAMTTWFTRHLLWTGSALFGLACLPGCLHPGPQAHREPTVADASENHPKLSAVQLADVQVAMGRALEKRGQLDKAVSAYYQAYQNDPKRADACLRLGVLHDQQGKFKESKEWYQKALAIQPGNSDTFCNMGYSLSLQQRWAEAEMNLRQAIVLSPEHARAHNNLGLVLAHVGRSDEALLEFRKAGCSEVDAQTNLAYVLTLEKAWSEARRHYEYALSLDASSTTAQKGIHELDRLVAKVAPAPSGDSQPASLAAPVQPVSLTTSASAGQETVGAQGEGPK